MDVCGIKRSMNGVPAADSSLARAFCCGGAWLDTIDGVLGGRGEAGEMAGAVMLPELLRLRLLGAETPAGKGNCFVGACLLYTSPSPRDVEESRMPSSA